jgi:hypothetical protein
VRLKDTKNIAKEAYVQLFLIVNDKGEAWVAGNFANMDEPHVIGAAVYVNKTAALAKLRELAQLGNNVRIIETTEAEVWSKE